MSNMSLASYFSFFLYKPIGYRNTYSSDNAKIFSSPRQLYLYIKILQKCILLLQLLGQRSLYHEYPSIKFFSMQIQSSNFTFIKLMRFIPTIINIRKVIVRLGSCHEERFFIFSRKLAILHSKAYAPVIILVDL